MSLRTRARLPRPVAALAALALALSGAVGLAFAVPGVANAAGAVSSTVDPQNGFPIWYQDSAGNRVEPCIDPNDPNCVLPAGDRLRPDAAGGVPDQLPGRVLLRLRDLLERGDPGLRRDRARAARW